MVKAEDKTKSARIILPTSLAALDETIPIIRKQFRADNHLTSVWKWKAPTLQKFQRLTQARENILRKKWSKQKINNSLNSLVLQILYNSQPVKQK